MEFGWNFQRKKEGNRVKIFVCGGGHSVSLAVGSLSRGAESGVACSQRSPWFSVRSIKVNKCQVEDRDQRKPLSVSLSASPSIGDGFFFSFFFFSSSVFYFSSDCFPQHFLLWLGWRWGGYGHLKKKTPTRIRKKDGPFSWKQRGGIHKGCRIVTRW